MQRDFVLSVMKDWGVIPYTEKGNVGNKVSDDLSGYKLVDKGDFVLNSMNLYMGSVGVSAYNGVTSTAYIVCKPSENVYAGYYNYLIQFKGFQEYVGLLGKGIIEIREAVRWTALKSVFVPLPDLPTQRRIAGFLDRETARIDRLIEKKQRLTALLGERVISLITQVTKHGLKDENHADTGIDWWSRAPASWEVHRIASLFRESKEMGEEDLPVLSVSINWGISDRELADEDRDRIVKLIEDKTSYKRVKPGDLVYNMMRAWQGAFGVAKVNGLVSPAYVVARPRKGLHSAYFEHLLRTPSCVEEFRRASKGIADFRQRLYWEHFRQVRLVLPAYDEQVEIAAYIESERTRSASIISKTQDSIACLREYRSALITAAVTGQIDVQTCAQSGSPDAPPDAIQAERGA